MAAATRIYDIVHKSAVVGLIGISLFGVYAIYAQINHLKTMKRLQIDQARAKVAENN